MTSAGPSAPLLALEDLSIHYGRVQALEHVSLEVRAGEVVTLIGANGAGKSTTLRSISRIVPIYRGRIAFDGRDISGVRPSDAVRLGIAQVPEGRRMLARQTVLDNLVLGAYTRSDGAEIQADVERQFARFPRLAERRPRVRAGSRAAHDRGARGGAPDRRARAPSVPRIVGQLARASSTSTSSTGCRARTAKLGGPSKARVPSDRISTRSA